MNIFHKPNRFLVSGRVLGTLQNFPQFAETFKCKNGTYMSPEKRCRVWWCAGLQHGHCSVVERHILPQRLSSPNVLGWVTNGGADVPLLLGTGRIRNRWIDKWIMHFMEVNQRTVPPETGGELSLWLRYCRSSNHILLHSGYNHSILVISSPVSSRFLLYHVWLRRRVFHPKYCTSSGWERSRQMECAGNRRHMNKPKHPLTLTLM